MFQEPGSSPHIDGSRVALPEGYYLDHFRRFVDQVASVYGGLLNDSERRLVTEFPRLSEREQRLFVRLSNRVGTVFFLSTLKYPEIESISEALSALRTKGFARAAAATDLGLCVESFHKRHLVRILRELGSTEPLHTWPKTRLQEEAKEKVRFETFEASPLYADVVVREFSEEIRFLCFLAFGDLRSDLKLYALRDLGIRGSNERPLRSRFQSAEEARSEYSYRVLREKLKESDSADSWLLSENAVLPPCIGAGALRVRERLIADAAQKLESIGRKDDALRLLALGTGARTVEKRIRLLSSLGREDEARRELEKIFDAPCSASLLFFAEDFAARKLGKRKKSAVTLALESAESVRLPATFRGRPEAGIVAYLAERGERAFHTENNLWLTLFGILFWEELFASEDSALFSEFDLVPRDLRDGSFYERRKERIEKKLRLLESATSASELFREVSELRFGTPNGIFFWDRQTVDLILELVACCSTSGATLGPIILRLAQDFEGAQRGFPDLLVFRDGRARFIEVKALGDRLQPAQLLHIRHLLACGFETSVVRVEWDYDPEQEYVVVDVETTGLSAELNRVIEIGAVKVRNGRIVDRFSSLVNPGTRIPRQITTLTGISSEMVAGAPRFEELACSFRAFTDGAIFVGHNARFDHSFIASEYRRLGEHFRMPTLCTATEMRRICADLESFSLEGLCREFQIGLERHHRALSDAEATAELLRIVLQAGQL